MLHERSARAIGNDAEVDAFAAQVKFLREKHQIFEEIPLEDDFSELNDYNAELVFSPASPLFRRKRIFWQESVCGSIAQFFGCRSGVIPKTNLKFVIGNKTTRRRVIDSYLHQHEQAVKQASEFIAGENSKQKQSPAEARLAKESFLLGFSFGLLQRLAQVKQAEEEIKTFHLQRSNQPDISQALVKSERIVISEQRQRIDSHIDQDKKSPEPKIEKLDDEAFSAGIDAARCTALSEELALPEQKVSDELDEIMEVIRAEELERQRRAVIYQTSIESNFYVFTVRPTDSNINSAAQGTFNFNE